MRNSNIKITAKEVVNAAPPTTGATFIRDTEVTGFALRVQASGVKAFIWEGRVKGRMLRKTLGRWPDLNVAQARTKALALRASIAQGIDPRRISAAEVWTFRRLCDAYMERHSRPHKRSWKADAARVQRFPRSWHARRLEEITTDDVMQLKTDFERSHGKYGVNHLVKMIRTMYNAAADWGVYTGRNPATSVKLFTAPPRKRYLSPDEVRRLNAALMEEPDINWRVYFPLTLLLGTRRSELLATRWADVDEAQRTLTLPETKNGTTHMLPLSVQALDLLQSLPSHGTSEQWIFPSRLSDCGHYTSPKHAWKRICTRAGIENARIHDLRRTFGSWLAASGYSMQLIGKALNHQNLATTSKVYAHLDLTPVRAAMEQHSTFVTGLLGAGK